MGISPSKHGSSSESLPVNGHRLFTSSMSDREIIQELEDEEEGMDTETIPNRAKKIRGNWTPEQDDALRAAVEKFEGKKWRSIANEVPGGHTHIQCLQRWQKVLKPGLVKGPWKPEEDELLRKYVPLEAKGNWVGIAQHVPGRTAKQCRERWYLCVDPTIRRDPWTQAEDDLLVSLHKEFGNGWALISQQLPGRTENSVKSRFKSLERKSEKMALKQAQAEANALNMDVNVEDIQVVSSKKKTPKRLKKLASSVNSQGLSISPSPVTSPTALQPVLTGSDLSYRNFGTDPIPADIAGGPPLIAYPSHGLDPEDKKELSAIRHMSSDQIHALHDFRATNSFENWMRESRDSGKISLDDVLLPLPDDGFDTLFSEHDFSLV